MFKTAVVTIASFVLAYPVVGCLVNVGLVSSPYAVMGALFIAGIANAYVITRFVKA